MPNSDTKPSMAQEFAQLFCDWANDNGFIANVKDFSNKFPLDHYEVEILIYNDLIGTLDAYGQGFTFLFSTDIGHVVDEIKIVGDLYNPRCLDMVINNINKVMTWLGYKVSTTNSICECLNESGYITKIESHLFSNKTLNPHLMDHSELLTISVARNGLFVVPIKLYRNGEFESIGFKPNYDVYIPAIYKSPSNSKLVIGEEEFTERHKAELRNFFCVQTWIALAIWEESMSQRSIVLCAGD